MGAAAPSASSTDDADSKAADSPRILLNASFEKALASFPPARQGLTGAPSSRAPSEERPAPAYDDPSLRLPHPFHGDDPARTRDFNEVNEVEALQAALEVMANTSKWLADAPRKASPLVQFSQLPQRSDERDSDNDRARVQHLLNRHGKLFDHHVNHHQETSSARSSASSTVQRAAAVEEIIHRRGTAMGSTTHTTNATYAVSSTPTRATAGRWEEPKARHSPPTPHAPSPPHTHWAQASDDDDGAEPKETQVMYTAKEVKNAKSVMEAGRRGELMCLPPSAVGALPADHVAILSPDDGGDQWTGSSDYADLQALEAEIFEQHSKILALGLIDD